MKPLLKFQFWAMISTVCFSGCAITTHTIRPADLGTPSSSKSMESLIDQPGPIELQTITSADWVVPLSGLLDLDHPAVKAAGIKERDEPIQIYVHVLKHPTRGIFIVDTGVSSKIITDPGSVGISWIVRKAMHTDKMIVRHNTAEILASMSQKLTGVFLTHLHIDHISGMPDIPNETPIYVGSTDPSDHRWVHLFDEGSVDGLLNGKGALQGWQFQSDPSQTFDGVVDIFGDASVFAIWAPGHTPGSTAYLVRTTQGPVLLTGDVSHTRWGWEHGVAPGSYTLDHELNQRSLDRLRALVARHPKIQVRLGHQPYGS